MNDLYIIIGILLGLVVGLLIGYKGRKERDERIKKLEEELTISRNVVEAQNGTISRLRKIVNKKKGGNGNDGTGLQDF